MNSMTGFSTREAVIAPFGKIVLEIRSTNHKFLETVFHLPVGFLCLEDKMKKEFEARLKRGRVVCVMSIFGSTANKVFVDSRLLKNYMATLKKIRLQANIKEEISLDTLIKLPGVFSLAEDRRSKSQIWPRLKNLVQKTLDDLVSARKKEGEALGVYFKKSSLALEADLRSIRALFKKLIERKTSGFKSPDECNGFLKDADITEEMERLAFHIKNFRKQLNKEGSVGKELDFIAQEMQREANTMGAKSPDAALSGRVVGVKSHIEKIREQLQNIE